MDVIQVFPFANKYEWENRVKLGEGGFGVVYKVKCRNSGDYVAIKEMDMSVIIKQNLSQALKTEIDLMKTLKGENLISLKDFHVGKRTTFMVLELCDGDLRKKMEEQGGKIKEEDAINVFCQILKGFKMMVDLGYVHRDIKPENTLYKGKTYKVADYGFSCKADMRCIQKMELICGTPLYMSPQLLRQQPYTAKSDIWSLGIMLFEMIFGYSPWACRDLDSYAYNIFHQPLAFPYNGKIGENTKDFIKRCLVVEQSKRIGWKQLFQHPLIHDKNTGQAIPIPQIQKPAVQIMKRIQQSAVRKNISLRQILLRRKIKNMDIHLFFEICRLMDPTISSVQVKILFDALDTSKDKMLEFDEFKALLLDNDFRDVDDIASRYIRELVQVAKNHRIDMRKLFESYDLDKSGAIDRKELGQMIREMLPRMSDQAINIIWKKFDQDQNNKIDFKEFLHEVTYGFADINSPEEIAREKAARCLKVVRSTMKYYNVKAEDIVQIFDRNGDYRLNFMEFRTMIQAIGLQVPEEELVLMFQTLDKNKIGSIAIDDVRSI